MHKRHRLRNHWRRFRALPRVSNHPVRRPPDLSQGNQIVGHRVPGASFVAPKLPSRFRWKAYTAPADSPSVLSPSAPIARTSPDKLTALPREENIVSASGARIVSSVHSPLLKL